MKINKCLKISDNLTFYDKVMLVHLVKKKSNIYILTLKIYLNVFEKLWSLQSECF